MDCSISCKEDSPMNRRELSLALAAAAMAVNPSHSRAAGDKEHPMRRIFITGSTEGLGRDAASTLIDEGHQVVLHARSKERASALKELALRAAGLVIGDLTSAAQTRGLDDQVN